MFRNFIEQYKKDVESHNRPRHENYATGKCSRRGICQSFKSLFDAVGWLFNGISTDYGSFNLIFLGVLK